MRRSAWWAGLAVATATLDSLAAAAPPARFDPRGVGGGGALFSPAFSPHRATELYLSCDMTELFHSTDLGRSWEVSDFGAIQGFHETKVQFTADPSVLYAIDYTSSNGIDHMRPVRSGDGGRTWVALPGDPTGGFDAYRLAADPTRTDRVLLTDWNRLWFSGDGGATFAARYTGRDSGAGLVLAGVVWDGADIWVGTNDGLLHSADGGQSFALAPVAGIPAGEVIWSLAGARQGATVRFVAVATDRGGTWNGMQGWEHWSYRNVYVLDWGQPAWRLATTGIAPGEHPFWAAMPRGNVQVMWLAGGNDAFTPTVHRSTDGGLTWRQTFLAASNQNVVTGWSGDGGDRGWGYGEVALGFDVSPVDPLVAAFSDYGFVHVTADGGATWRQGYVAAAGEHPAGAATPRGASYASIGIEDTTSWCVAWSGPDQMFACFSDIRGIRSQDGGATWSFDYTGHTLNSMYRVIAAGNGRLYGATSSVHDLYQSTYLQDSRIDGGTGQVLASADGGRSWTLVHDFGHPVIWVAGDPAAPNRLYASVVHSTQGGVFVSDDVQNGPGSSWRRLAAPPRTEGHPFNVVVLADGTIVSSWSGRRDAGGAFTPSSGVFVSGDGGATWADRSAPGMRYWTKDVVIDPHDPAQNTWYAGVFSGWGGPANNLGGLYRTRDRGVTWTRIAATYRVTSLTVSPVDRNEAYLTTETDGLLHTADLDAAAPSFTRTAYPFRQPERVFFNPYDPAEVWVTSFGNGLRVGRIGAAPATLLRSDRITSLAPVTPPLATVLPLQPARDAYATGFSAGSLDPEAAVLGDAARPLVGYGLDGPGRVTLVKEAGRIRIHF